MLLIFAMSNGVKFFYGDCNFGIFVSIAINEYHHLTINMDSLKDRTLSADVKGDISHCLSMALSLHRAWIHNPFAHEFPGGHQDLVAFN